MQSRFRKIVIIVVTIFLTLSLAISDTALAARARDYTPQEFRSVLQGLGYDVALTNAPLTDEPTRRAIRDFQQRYKLSVDGVAGPNTQNVAADLVRNLQGSLNLVVKPNPSLPRNQFYGPQTTAAVRAFQRKFNLQETGIASLPVRVRLDEEARAILDKPPLPTRTPTPTPTPTSTPTPIPLQ
jgi:peptidoglycan hydrolase-like protein with peptidoglycan-binding domain